MERKDFTGNREVLKIIEDAKKRKIDKKAVSDLIDPEGLQYVDLVQEGGGILGIALTGYTYVLEEMGIRFFSLAGTSAGAINTMLLASFGSIQDPKSRFALDSLCDKNLLEFIDGPRCVRRSIDIVLNHKKLIRIAPKALCLFLHFKKHFGLNPGDNFYNWISGVLKSQGIESTRDLYIKRAALPRGLRLREGIEGSIEGVKTRLVLITTEVTTESRIQFPEMNILFWRDPESVNPAAYVRASMSVPGFFHPFRVSMDREFKSEISREWKKLIDYEGPLPDKAVFVDGGMVSNFPVDVFHEARIPRWPTFGVKLGDDRNKPNKMKKPGAFAKAVFNSARNVFDYEFIRRNRDYKHLVCHIDVGEHNWLDFSISEKNKIDLFVRGARAAAAFLDEFNWEDYKKIRSRLLLENT